MKVLRGKVGEFSVRLPRPVNDYSQIEAVTVFEGQIIERWKAIKQFIIEGSIFAPSIVWQFVTGLGRADELQVVVFQYDDNGPKYPKNRKGILEVQASYAPLPVLNEATGGFKFDILTEVITTFEKNEPVATLTVAYDSQGGSPVASGATTVGGSISAPSSPTREGHTFNGWFVAPSGGSAIVFPYAHNQSSNFTLFAQWSVVLTPPSQVDSLTGIPGNQQVVLGWSAPFQSGSSPVTGYVVEQSANGGTTWQGLGTVSVGQFQQQGGVVVSSLTNGTQYFFRVAATNSSGTGPFTQTGPHMPFVVDVVFDPSTSSGFNESVEWAEVHNRSVVPVDFTGWRMTSHVAGPGPANPCILGATPQTFTFPDGFTLPPNGKVRVYSGFGAAAAGTYDNPNGNPPTLEWNSSSVWLNGGDVARLYRPQDIIGVSAPFAELKTGSCVNDPIPND
jgi:uncharacterized repeat protein (TIGR02543 family)